MRPAVLKHDPHDFGFRWRASAVRVALLAVLAACSERSTTVPTDIAQAAFSVSFAVGSDGKLHLNGSDVRVARPIPGFVETERISYVGEKLGSDGCRVSSEVRLRKGEKQIERFAETHLPSCSFVLVRGTGPSLEFADSSQHERRRAALKFAASSGLMASTQLAPTRIRRSNTVDCGWPAVDMGTVSQNILWLDPVAIPVASDLMYMRWNYNWICALGFDGYHDMTWFLASGWSLVDWYTFPFLTDYYWSWIEGKGYSYFRNPGGSLGFPLCTSEVWANVRRNSVIGYADGSATFSQTSDMSGPACIYLLEHRVYRSNS